MIRVKESISPNNRIKVSFGGMGGFFKKGMRWKDYISAIQEEKREYAEATRQWILDNGIRATGYNHQYDDGLTPLFNDRTVAALSMRAWGDLLAAIWSEEEDKDYSYMDFYS